MPAPITIATLIQDILDHTASSTTVMSQTIREEFVNGAIRRCARFHTFRGQRATADLTYGASEDSIALPVGFVTELAVWSRSTSITDPSRRLSPIDRTLRRMWIEAQDPQTLRDSIYPNTARPGALTTSGFYYIWLDRLHIVPTPTATTYLTIDYTRLLPDLTGTDANWFTEVLPDVVRAGALVEAYLYLHEDERAAAWDAVYAKRITDAIRYDETLTLSGPPASRGRG